MKQDKFSLFIPIEIEKGKSKDPKDRYENMRFKGVASNPNTGLDADGEWLDPRGFDLNDFLSTGTINYHHLWKKSPAAIIGEPIAAKITKGGELYVEGKLWKSSPLARDVYDVAEVMEKDSDTRRMGFSIEGIPVERDPNNEKRILKAKITNLAITPAPKNKGTRMELVKGGFDKFEYEPQEGSEYLLDKVEDGIRYRITPDLEIIKEEIEKGGPGSGRHKYALGSKVRVKLHRPVNPNKFDEHDLIIDRHEFDEQGNPIYGGRTEKGKHRWFGDKDIIEKGGEGSRGGKVIGHTKSGKPIYQNSHYESSQKGFTANDHKDALDLHKKEKRRLVSEGKYGDAENHDDAIKHHKMQVEKNEALGKRPENKIWKPKFGTGVGPLSKAMTAGDTTGTDTTDQLTTGESLKDEALEGTTKETQTKKKKNKRILSKGEIYNRIFSSFNIDNVDQAKKIYTVIQKVQQQLDHGENNRRSS